MIMRVIMPFVSQPPLFDGGAPAAVISDHNTFYRGEDLRLLRRPKISSSWLASASSPTRR